MGFNSGFKGLSPIKGSLLETSPLRKGVILHSTWDFY